MTCTKPELDNFVRALAATDTTAARRAFEQVGAPPLQKAESLIVPALESLGKDWEEGRLALSQIYMASRMCERLLDEVLPPLSPARKDQPKTAIAVLDDHHVLGKRIVCSVLRASGWELVDLGRLSPAQVVEEVQARGIRILLISVLLFRSALEVREVRRLLDQGKDPVRLVVGGAPFVMDAELWRNVGADATGKNAAEAVSAVARMAASLTEEVQ